MQDLIFFYHSDKFIEEQPVRSLVFVVGSPDFLTVQLKPPLCAQRILRFK